MLQAAEAALDASWALVPHEALESDCGAVPHLPDQDPARFTKQHAALTATTAKPLALQGEMDSPTDLISLLASLRQQLGDTSPAPVCAHATLGAVGLGV